MPSSRSRVSLTAATALLAFVAAGCSAPTRSALTLDGRTQRPEIRVVLCDGEIVNAVTLRRIIRDDEEAFEARPIWRIEAKRRTSTTRFVVGNTPSGFEEVKALSGQHLDGLLELAAETSPDLGARDYGGWEEFRMSDLREGELRQYRSPISLAEFERSSRAACSANPFDDYGLPSWVGWIFLAVIGIVYAGVTTFGIRSWLRTRRLRSAGVIK